MKIIDKLLFKYAPILYIILIWFLFASPFFLKGLVPYSSTYQVNFFPPWSQYQKFLGPIKNNAMPDVTTQIYPWKKLTIDTYKSGYIPVWNPYSFSGNPQLANFQTAVFSPFNILFFIFSFINAWSIMILLQPLLSGIFMYILLRKYEITKSASVLGSIGFMFSGFIVVWMAYGTLGFAILFLPLLLFFIEKYEESRNKVYLFLYSLGISLTFFSGHFQTSLYLLLFVIGYILWFYANKKNIRLFLSIILMTIIGIGFSMIQLFPSIKFYQYAVRSTSYIAGGGIPLSYLITLISPDFYGNPVTRNDWYGFYAEWSSFIGIVPLFFALFGAFFVRNKKVFFYTILTIIIFVFAVDSFVQPLLGISRIPVLSTSAPSRIIVLLSFSLCVLAGYGFDAFWKSKLLSKKNILFMSIMGLFFGLVWIYLLIGKPFSIEYIQIAKRNFILPTIFFLAVVGLFFFAQAFNKKKNIVFFCSGLIIFLASFDSYRFAQKWMPFDPKELAYPATSVIQAIQDNIGSGRMFGNFGGEVAVYYKIPSIEGYDPLYIERYGEFIRTASNGIFQSAERSVVKLDRKAKYIDRVLDITGVNLIFHPISDTHQSWAFNVWDDKSRFSKVYQDSTFELYRNNLSLGRAHIFYKYAVIKEKYEILKMFFSPDFSYRDTLILEEDPRITILNIPTQGTATIIKNIPDLVQVAVINRAPGILLLSDNYYPGWKARLIIAANTIEAKVFRVNYTFRGVVVPEGKFIVEFYYSPF